MVKRWLGPGLAIGLALCYLLVNSVLQRQSGAIIEQGDRDYLYWHVDEAMARYREVSGRGDWHGWERVGWLSAILGRDADAVDAFSKALAIVPGNRKVLLQLAAAATRQHRWSLAQDALRQVLAQMPPSLQARFLMGGLEREQGHLLRAEAWYRRGLEINPNYYLCHLELARLLEARQAWPAAEAEYRACLGLNRQLDASASYHDALTLLHLGQVEAAVRALRRATESDPKQPEAWFTLGALEHDAGAPDWSTCLQTFLQLQPAGDSADKARRLLRGGTL